MIYNVVLVSGVQQSDSVIHIHIPILFQILRKAQILNQVSMDELQKLRELPKSYIEFCLSVGSCTSGEGLE